jgi:hypothetical protein
MSSVAFPLVEQAKQVTDRIDINNALGFTSGIAEFKSPELLGAGSLAMVAAPKGTGDINIVQKYDWTVSNKNRSDIPAIKLEEHKIEGGSIQKQFAFYANGISNATSDFLNGGGAQETRGILDVYDEIFVPNKTGFTYFFPYFAKVSYELTTSQWQQFDSISQSLGQITSGVGKLFGGAGEKLANLVTTGAEAAGALAQTALQFKYPVVGIADRPRIFTAHSERSITIEFPLYNTIRANEWLRNKDFIDLFMSQNLFNKRNFITGLPPCWYKVTIPGIYYSVASCVTNIAVENLGNTRMLQAQGFGANFIVPDAYQVRITLQEMAMPSKNQFEYAKTGMGVVQSSTITSTATVTNAIEAAVLGRTPQGVVS